MDEYGEGMDIDKACKAFRGFKKYCKKDDWSKVDVRIDILFHSGRVGRQAGQTLGGSSSAVSQPIFTTYSF